MREPLTAQTENTPRPGDIVGGKYRVERELAHGSRGVILATSSLSGAQAVAVKWIPSALVGDDESFHRLQGELRLAVAMRSSQVVRLVELGREGQGAVYVVMEHLQGESLGARLARAPAQMPVPEAIGYLMSACHGIGEAHARQFAHHNLKPSHLFLAVRPDGKSHLKVIDFGTWSAPLLPDTSRSARLAHLRYQAPEQVSPNRKVDARADIWALGCILYELLSGAPAFAHELEAELPGAIVARQPVPLASRRGDLSPALVAVVNRCLAKDPAQRFTHAAELAVTLRPFLDPPRQPSRAMAAARMPPPAATRVMAPPSSEKLPQSPAETRSADSSSQREVRAGQPAGPRPARPPGLFPLRLQDLTNEELLGIGNSDVVARLLETFRSPEYRPPRLPAAAVQLLELSRKSDVAVGQIVALLQNEQLLAAELLKLAQSARYSGNASVRTLDEAIVRLGIPRTADLFLEAAMNMRVFRAPGYQEQLDRLRRHSAAVAQLARLVSQKTAINDAHAFLCGLLHDIGIAAALIAFAELGPRGGAPAFELVWPAIFEAHEDCAGVLARLWQLPAEVALVVSHHHHIELSGRVHPTAAAIAVADWAAGEAGLGFEERDEEILGRATQALRIDSAGLDRLVQAARELQGQL